MRNRKSLNQSSEFLHINHRSGNLNNSIDEIEFQKMQKKRLKREGLSHLYNADYQPAVYKVACQYRDARSYKKKLGNSSYRELQLFEDTKELKAFGLGPYLYVEFMRRVVWLFFFLSLLEGIRIYIFSTSHNLGSYSVSFSTFLISTTIGNYNGPVMSEYDNFIVTIIPAVVIVAIFIFFLIWHAHYSSTISEQQQSNQAVKPQKFCVQVEGMNESNVDQEDLERFFSTFGPIYEVSLVRRHKNKLSYFQQLQQLDEQIKEQQLEMILGSGDQDNLKGLKKQRDQLNKYIHTLRINPHLLSAYIHFQYQKSKVDMLTYYNDHYLFNSFSHALVRSLCCCCLDDPTALHHYKGRLLYIKADKIPQPEDINWESREISAASKSCRIFIVIIIIILFVAVSCTVIGLCSVYVSSNSINCEGVVIPKNATQARAANQNQTDKTCFCNSNLFNSFQDSSIGDYCGVILSKLYTQQGIQWAVVATSGITNFLFGMIVHWMVNLTRPQSFSSGLLVKTVVYTFFMIFNTVILPLLIYADIFGFKASSYVSFITLVSNDARQFFKVDSIAFQVDFNTIWYRNVSPIFTNYIVFDILVTWGFFLWYKCISSKSGLETDQGTILQKHMNHNIIAWKFNVYAEFSYFLLVMVMGTIYSGGIPVLIPLTFISLLTKYIMARSLLQNNSSRIQGLGQAYNSFSLTLLPILLIPSALIAEWMLTGNSSIYPNGLSMSISLFSEANFMILNRQLYLPFYIIIALVIAVYFLFYNTIVRFCSWLASLCYNKKVVVHPYHARPFSEYAKGLNMICSYNIRNNDKFKMAIINMEKYLTSAEKESI